MSDEKLSVATIKYTFRFLRPMAFATDSETMGLCGNAWASRVWKGKYQIEIILSAMCCILHSSADTYSVKKYTFPKRKGFFNGCRKNIFIGGKV